MGLLMPGVPGAAWPCTVKAVSQLPCADSYFGFVTSCLLVRGLNEGWKRLAGLEEELLSCRQSWLVSFVPL